MIQPKRETSARAEPGSGVEAAVRAVGRGGEPLSQELRAYFEPRFGRGFDQVRVHTDDTAARAASEVRARAYTLGHDIVFARGQYQPQSSEGRRLLAHELTHVAQQEGAGSLAPQAASLEVSHPSDPLEAEADAVAEAVLKSDGAVPTPHAATGPQLQRACPPERSGLGATAPTASCEPGSLLFVRGPKVKFCLDSDALLDGQDKLVADMAAKASGATEIEIHGNASTEGPSAEYNRNLACHRASALATLLAAKGVSVKPRLVAHEPTAVYGDAIENRNAVLVIKTPGPGPTPQPGPEPKNEPKKESPPPEKELPKGNNALDGCEDTQAQTIREAVSQALADLDVAIAALGASPPGDQASHALFLAFRKSDEATAHSVADTLRKIRAGLASGRISCDQKDAVLTVCGGETAAFTNMITKVIHLCMAMWDTEGTEARARTLVHEGAHAFAGMSADGEAYFTTGCSDTNDTARATPESRLRNADGYACVVHHLAHQAADEVKREKEMFSGEALKSVLQSKPHGPISLSAEPKSTYFMLNRSPTAGGFTYRWRLYDEAGNHYLLRAREGEQDMLDWLTFTSTDSVIIGRKTRDLLQSRGVTKGRIECTARIPAVGEKTVTVDVEFKP